MDDHQLRSEILRLGPWHHDIEVVPGVRTGEVTRSHAYPAEFGDVKMLDAEAALTHLTRGLYPAGLESRSVLDCACNAGGWLFGAARLGAGRCFGFDARQHWIEQARFVARQRPSENIEFAQAELATLPQMNVGSFDITLFMGIFYHLPDPVAGLKLAADRTRELLFLNTMITRKSTDALVLKRESDTDVMSGVDGLAWIPGSERVLREILLSCGFPHTRVAFRQAGEANQDRIGIFAAREEKTFSDYDRVTGPPQTSSRRRQWLPWRAK
jgi:tRNA (mo5U34)-methyltransferase